MGEPVLSDDDGEASELPDPSDVEDVAMLDADPHGAPTHLWPPLDSPQPDPNAGAARTPPHRARRPLITTSRLRAGFL